jgi:plasmid stability protein
MAQVLIRNLSELAMRALKQRAAQSGKKLEPFLREKLEEMALIDDDFGATERIAARYPALGEIDLEALVREERDR